MFCKYCGEKNPDDSLHCIGCGKMIGKPAVQNKTQEKKRRYCKNCGAEVNATLNFCLECGTPVILKSSDPVVITEPVYADQEINKGKNKKIVAGILAGIVGFALIGHFFSSCSSENVRHMSEEDISTSSNYSEPSEKIAEEPSGSHSVEYDHVRGPLYLSSADSWLTNDQKFTAYITKVDVSVKNGQTYIRIHSQLTYNQSYDKCEYKYYSLRLENNGLIAKINKCEYGSLEFTAGTTVEETWEFYFPENANTDIDKMVLKTSDADSTLNLYYDGEYQDRL